MAITATPGIDAWDLSPAAAIALQRELAQRVVCVDASGLSEPRMVAGVDVGFEQAEQMARAAVVLLSLPRLQPVAHSLERVPVHWPYIPGLLSFRELPAVLAAWQALAVHPDVVLCDGQGIAHPRRLGIASHLGVLLDVPTIGVGKTRLVGRYTDPPQRRGAWSELRDRGEVIGAVLRTRVGVRPLFISIGHRITLPTAVDLVLRCTGRYRLPETTRAAHRLASAPAHALRQSGRSD